MTTIYESTRFLSLIPEQPAAPDPEDLVRLGNLVGICATKPDANGLCVVDLGPSVRVLEVEDANGTGIAPGDAIFLNAAATALTNTSTGYFFGFALEEIEASSTEKIMVLHTPAPGAGTVGAGTIGTAALAAGLLSADAAGRAKMAANWFNPATVVAKFADGAFDATTLAKFADGLFTAAKIGDDEITGTQMAPSVLDDTVSYPAVVLRYEVADMATGSLDFDLDHDIVILDAWLTKTVGPSSNHAHTLQIQTAGGAANISDAVSLDNIPLGNVVRVANLQNRAVAAGAGAIRVDVVRADAAGQIDCELCILAVRA